MQALDRTQRSDKPLWNSMAQLDERTVGVIHAGHLLVGSLGELQNVLTR